MSRPTIRTRLGRLFGHRERCPECDAELAENVAHCDVCGYDLATRTRASVPNPPVR